MSKYSICHIKGNIFYYNDLEYYRLTERVPVSRSLPLSVPDLDPKRLRFIERKFLIVVYLGFGFLSKGTSVFSSV